ncbi:hypothetical protein QFC20_007656 [Naganishia adeliensis]|uniref:Uncharacterized protein n=1 Tax=Naganishia adeliensis TaxID=92952 RepID=A0ACC2UWV6_9TREE|nr:hypothetical protein QFC20_007656 [Naganishia adeliensis]
MSSLNMYSIWLCPKPSQSADLQKTIDHLAQKHQPAPTFPPHVTFFSGIDTSVPLEQVKATLKTGLVRWSNECELAAFEDKAEPTLKLSLDLPISGRDLTVPAEPSLVEPDTTLSADAPKRTAYEALVKGRQILEQVFDKKPSKAKKQEELQGIADGEFAVTGAEEEGKLQVAEEIELTRATIVACVGKTEEWKEVARFDLEGNDVKQ